MILNTGRWTDIVQYYTDWLLQRFSEGAEQTEITPTMASILPAVWRWIFSAGRTELYSRA